LETLKYSEKNGRLYEVSRFCVLKKQGLLPLPAVSGIFKALAETLEIAPHPQKGVAGGEEEGSPERDGRN
jgi:hypothetical protein